jgi:hypothetical protein
MQKREGRLHLQEKDLACGADRDVGEEGGSRRQAGGHAAAGEAGEKQEEQKQSRSRAEAEQKQSRSRSPVVKQE